MSQIASRTYRPGNQYTWGPVTPTPGTYYQVDIVPTQNLPAGVSLNYTFQVSRDGGATWTWNILGPNTSAGPLTPSDLDIGVSLDVPADANWRAQIVASVVGGNWTTGFTITETTSPFV